MPEKVMPGPVQDTACIREAVCIHTKKIYDSCKDKDCIEDLRFYPTQNCQAVIDRAISIKAGKAELLYVYIDVEPIGFNRGFYTVDVRYYYRVTADAFIGAARPVEVCGLCVFDKREAVDPIVLNMKLVDVCECRPCDCELTEIPPCICACFGCDLCFGNDGKRIYVTLGQFSIIRLERDSQLLMPVYDYCMPEKECTCGGCEDDPCEIFRHVKFPVNEFFPPNSPAPIPETCRELKGCCG